VGRAPLGAHKTLARDTISFAGNGGGGGSRPISPRNVQNGYNRRSLINDPKLWNVAAARIKGFVMSIPQWPHQGHVAEYHQIVEAFQKSCTGDFSTFKIPESAMSLEQHRPPDFFGQTIEGYRYCDSVIFRTKVFSLVNYVVSIAKESQPRPTPSVKKTPDLKEMASQIYIGEMHGSQIVQHSPNTSIRSTYNAKSPEFKELIASIKAAVPQLQLDQGRTNQLYADIGTVEVQINAPVPKHGIIIESMHSIRNILEGAVGSAIASGLLRHIIQYFPK